VNPTERVIADAELAGVVGPDDGVCELVLRDDRAPPRSFASHADGIGNRPQFGQAERGQMGRPLGFGAEFEAVCADERLDDAVRQIGRAHVGFHRRVDRVAGPRRCAEQGAEERGAGFVRPGAERGEPVGAELRRGAALAGVARSGVVDADQAGSAKTGGEDGLLLGAEQVQFGDQEPRDLTLRPPDLILFAGEDGSLNRPLFKRAR